MFWAEARQISEKNGHSPVKLPVIGLDSADAGAAAAPGLAGLGGGHGVRGSGAEPVRDDGTNAGAADALVRQIPLVHAELAGDRHVSGGCGIWRAGVQFLVPLFPAFPG